MTVTCGPPPNTLNLGTQWDAEWTVNGVVIEPDETHSISNNYTEGKSTLTVSKFLRTDDGKQYSHRVDNHDIIEFLLMC